MKLTINTRQWLRGEGHAESRLRRATDGKMCCLGFLALACGAHRDDITGRDEPRWGDGINWHPDLRDVQEQLIVANDDEQMTDEDRKKRITRLFAQVGVEVTFVEGADQA